eukprot:15436690-Alexandrium_andersonii.AAC.1
MARRASLQLLNLHLGRNRNACECYEGWRPSPLETHPRLQVLELPVAVLRSLPSPPCRGANSYLHSAGS